MPANNTILFLPDIGLLHKIFVLGIPLHANVFSSFTHNAVVPSQLICVHPENQTKMFKHFHESKQMSLTQDLKWSQEQCSALQVSFHTASNWFVTLYCKVLFPSEQWSKHGCQQFSLFYYLEVNKYAFTFSSEIRQIQCTRTEFWCVQCPRPTGPSALDKHQIQASALDLSYFMSKSKSKFINLIHTRQKNKIICSCSWKIINKMVLECH